MLYKKSNMFTLEDLAAAHAKVRSGADFPAYIRELKNLGVKGYTTFVNDGHTVFSASNSQQVLSPAKYAVLQIADISSSDQFKKDLQEHQQGKTSYLEFCSNCAVNGIDHWKIDMTEMTCIYYDHSGAKVLTEKIPG